MKILHVNTNDILGGAARAAYRVHRALLKKQIDSQMLVQRKESNDFTVIGPETKLQKLIGLFRPTLDAIPLHKYKNKTKTLFSPSWLPSKALVNKINAINPDVVHLHWICGGMIKIEDLSKIKPPIVWSLHDMWAFTGGEHYDEGQNHFIEKCGNSQVLNSNKEIDLSRKGWLRKKKTYDKMGDFIVIGLSEWMKKSAEESSLLSGKRKVLIPNLLDTEIYKPFNKEEARKLWGLPLNKKLILFGAIGATTDPRKGFLMLKEALKKIEVASDLELVVFGSEEPKNPPEFGFKTNYVGSLADDVSLVTLYSAVDVMIVPSKQEAFGQTASEAMSCGTPVVAFDCTGLKDIVDHKKNGYLATPFDSNDLKTGIEWVLNNENFKNLSQNSRDKVLENFAEKNVVNKYIELYEDILK